MQGVTQWFYLYLQGKETAVHKQKVESARRELTDLLRTPLINSEFCGRYPTMSGRLPTKLFRAADASAVEALQKDQMSSQNILKKKNKKPAGNADKKFKGFKNKKKKKAVESNDN